MSFNGEIYNHVELRDSLNTAAQHPDWRGSSDTETFLAAIEHWGVERALERSVGMFAFALWDRHDRSLTLARDRIGEKPLYYGWQSGRFFFASELKALRTHPDFEANIDREALRGYFDLGFIAAPQSIYRGIKKLVPGSYLTLDAGYRNELPTPTSYWSLDAFIARGDAAASSSPADAVNEVEDALTRSIEMQRIADVPLGAFLSGGIDSSTVVALMQKAASRPVKTFTIGFSEAQFDESSIARDVADRLGTDHTELQVTPVECMEAIPRLPVAYDEPFGDSSAIPMLLVSELASRSVTVSLSGDGGDELFAGYTRYGKVADIWARTGRLPRLAKKLSANGLSLMAGVAPRDFARRMQRFASLLGAENVVECYDAYLRQRVGRRPLVLGANDPVAATPLPGLLLDDRKALETMMYVDTLRYLPDDILTKVDRAAMHVSLETRVPMLDPRVVELAWSIAPRAVGHRPAKWILRQILARYVPEPLFDRPKMGFGVPVGTWIRGPLREWAESLLDPQVVRDQGLLDEKQVSEDWRLHLANAKGSHDRIWHVLMLQAWCAENHEAPERVQPS